MTPTPADDPDTDPVADLRRRVEALERAATSGPAAEEGPAAGGATTDGAAASGSATGPAPAPGASAPPGAPPDAFWALAGLQARLDPGRGGVLLTGHVPLHGGGLAVWQEARDVDDLLDADADALAAALSALASPVRLRMLRAVMRGTTGSGELAADDGFGTTGQVHHHLRQLVAAGWLRPTTRGHYAVPVERVVPLLAALAAAAR